MTYKSAVRDHPEAVYTDIVVPPECENLRADVFVTQYVDYASRSKVRSVIQRGDLCMGDTPIKPATRLQPGDIIRFWRLPPDRPSDIQPLPQVIYEDAELLIINKPPHLTTHPSKNHYYRTVTQWLKMRARSNTSRAHPCHRLDKETTGIMVIAKTKQVEGLLKQAFMNGQMQKCYHAVVVGQFEHAQTISTPLRLQNELGLVRIKMIPHPEGLPAETSFIPLHYEPLSHRTLVACFPKTGRQHQIRAHLSTLGFPIVGDKLYNAGETFFDRFTKGQISDKELNDLESSHHLLHAHSISSDVFPSASKHFEAPYPDSWPYWAHALKASP